MNGVSDPNAPGRRQWLMLGAAWSCGLTTSGSTLANAPDIPRIGVIYPGPASDPGISHDLFRQGLREQGLVEGRSVRVEWRWDARAPEQLAAQVQELLRLPAALLVAGHTGATRAAMRLTRSVPIVMAVSADPVADGLVASLARPGGNVTGLSIMSPELAGRRLQLLKDTVPGLARVGMLLDPSARWREDLAESEAAARVLGLTVTPLHLGDPADLDAVFGRAREARVQAIVVSQSPTLSFHWQRIAELALAARLPAMSGSGDGHFARLGGLMNFGASIPASWHRAAHYVRRILQGAPPATLPIEQPSRFELVINRQTAERLGLTLPPHVLLRADQVV